MTSSLKAILRKPAVPGNTLTEQSTSRGRPYVAFGESSEKTKKRRIEELVLKYTLEELSFAETLALYLQLDLSQRKYNLLRSIINSVHSEFLPSIYKLRQFRDSLLPKDIINTVQGSEINLQQLLDYTLKSILKSILDKEYIKSETLTLTCKYGFDGSSGHSTYKQVFSSTEMTDEYLFLVAMSPLNLSDEKGYIFWNNPRSSSKFFCRPIKFIFVKENSYLVKTEVLRLQQEINDLKPIIINFQNKNYTVNFKFHFTMLDGSCINILSETNSTQTCFICGATPKQMNTKEVLKRPVKIENFNFGMSSLHSWIRSFECLLRIAYRLSFISWQVKGTEKKFQIVTN
ncbi:uncharacterized protein LOC129236425 isoform X2 [Anastrepha obliqua]|uniref:uncharacterized protein LOC129236425 isoform X2 n=1 Tax=Anastrepha obliqua TaxID=95512 RepID=UPI002408FF06|nr:uncharacterized protein LOC129236425 isoform X2 [Anastrepha obliqua]